MLVLGILHSVAIGITTDTDGAEEAGVDLSSELWSTSISFSSLLSFDSASEESEG